MLNKRQYIKVKIHYNGQIKDFIHYFDNLLGAIQIADPRLLNSQVIF